jgi:hypothetical protein
MAANKAEDYRARAIECEEIAAQTVDSVIKAQYIKMAQEWHTLAAYQDKKAQTDR